MSMVFAFHIHFFFTIRLFFFFSVDFTFAPEIELPINALLFNAVHLKSFQMSRIFIDTCTRRHIDTQHTECDF